MIKGYTLPRTPSGKSSIVPKPPWHYIGNVLAVEFLSDRNSMAAFLPDGLEADTDQCSAYFIEWQYSSDNGKEYLDPVRSQYRETIILISAGYKQSKISYCPFIWVDQDKALMRGLIQGWPKQIGQTWISRSYDLPSKAAPEVGKGGKFAAALSVDSRRLVEAEVTLSEKTEKLPVPGFSSAVLVRYFPELVKSRQDNPSVHELVQLKSRDMKISPVWKGEASLKFFDHPYTELPDIKIKSVKDGYRFTVALTIDDLIRLRNL